MRTHAKTHKSVEVARRQLEAGAVGISVATIGEAERLTDGGIGNLLITSPLVTPAKLARLRALLERAEGLMTVADSLAGVDGLAEAVAGTDRRLIVLVDLGVGRRRTMAQVRTNPAPFRADRCLVGEGAFVPVGASLRRFQTWPRATQTNAATMSRSEDRAGASVRPEMGGRPGI